MWNDKLVLGMGLRAYLDSGIGARTVFLAFVHYYLVKPMKVGTKSLLFGVHQFLWHPLTVWLAFRKLYRIPSFWETVAILVHDWGYWGCPNMDGEEGKCHPALGAEIVQRLWWKFNPGVDTYWFIFTASHSREVAKRLGVEPSKLCWADKASIYFEPEWFYLLRARLSGEIKEFRRNAAPWVHPKHPHKIWLTWIKRKVLCELLGYQVLPDITNSNSPIDPGAELV